MYVTAISLSTFIQETIQKGKYEHNQSIARDDSNLLHRRPVCPSTVSYMQEAERILKDADKEDVAFLVVGDPFGLSSHVVMGSSETLLSRSPERIVQPEFCKAVIACGDGTILNVNQPKV
eukprot:1138198-Pelagomonas_calceolata.AAC.1